MTQIASQKHLSSARNVSAWYGLSAEIAVEDNLWHLVRIGRITLNHPPVVNLLLRRGQPEQDRLTLSFLHEFGHLQTLPIAIFHLLWLLLYGQWRKPHKLQTGVAILAIAVAHQATWELASETYVLARSRTEYKRIYHNYPNRLGRLTFWGSMTMLSIFLTNWVMKNNLD